MKHVHAELIKQWVDNQSLQFEFRMTDDEPWVYVGDPAWSKFAQYRIKPAPDPYEHLRAAIRAGKSIAMNCNGNWRHLLDYSDPNRKFSSDLEYKIVEPDYTDTRIIAFFRSPGVMFENVTFKFIRSGLNGKWTAEVVE